MNYEEKYQNLINQLKKAKGEHGGYTFSSVVDKIVPELRESEDERIKKEIVKLVQFYYGSSLACKHTVSMDDMVAWLEKQGGKVDALDDFPTEFERQVSHLIASSINKEWDYTEGFVKYTANALLQYAKNELKKQGEKKPTDKSLDTTLTDFEKCFQGM